jgi:hypothetical protein
MNTCVLATQLLKKHPYADRRRPRRQDPTLRGRFPPWLLLAGHVEAAGWPLSTNAEAMTTTLWSSLRHKGDHRSNGQHKNVEPGSTMRRLLARRAAAARLVVRL